MIDHSPQVGFKRVGAWLAAATLAFGLVFVAVLFSRDSGRIAALWFLTPFVVVVLLRRPRAEWFLILSAAAAGNLGANFAVGDGILRAALLTCGNLVEALVIATLLTRGYRVRLTRRSGLIRLVRAGAIGCGGAAIFTWLALVLTGGNPPVAGTLLWIAAHGVSLIVFAPLLMLIIEGRVQNLFRDRPVHASLTLSFLVLVLTLIFMQSKLPLLFLAPVALALVSFQLGLAGSSMAVLAVTVIAIPLTLSGLGPIALVDGSLTQRMFVLQLFIGSASLMALTVAGAVSERRSLIRRLTRARRYTQDRLIKDRAELGLARLSEQLSNVGYWTLTTATGRILWSPEVYRIHGVDPSTFNPSRDDLFAFYTPEDRRVVIETMADCLDHDTGWSLDVTMIRRNDGQARLVKSLGECRKAADGRVIGFFGLFKDLTDERQMVSSLREAQGAAEAAVLVKATFLANMSHEIRTPLNGVLGFADLLSRTDLRDEQRSYIDNIRMAGRALSLLIDDILDFSRLEAGKLPLAPYDFDLSSLIDEAVGLVAVGPVGGGIDFSVTLAPEITDVLYSDGARIRQILLNLIGNAAKFTGEGTVTVAADLDNRMLRLTISDTGPGIAPDRLEVIFDGFTQEDNSTSRRYGGAGLGLSISRSLARLLGGDLTIDSQLGQGTKLTLILPHVPGNPLESPSATFVTASAPNDQRPMTDRLKVMVVDDFKMNRELVEIALRQAGHMVTGFSTASAAMAALADGIPFDMILMDVQMPEMDGLTATRHIRALSGPAAEIPIVGLTAEVMPEQVAACREAGMDSHIAKPVDLERLLTTVDSVAARRGLLPLGNTAAGASRSDALIALFHRYTDHLQTLPEEVGRLKARSEPGHRAAGLAALAHSVAGISGSFGLGDISRAAFHLESVAKQVVAGRSDLDRLEQGVTGFVDSIEQFATHQRRPDTF